METGPGPGPELEKRVERIQQALSRSYGAQAERVVEAAERSTAHALRHADQQLERLSSRELRRAAKRRRWEERHAGEGPVHGVVYAGAAVVMVGFAATQPHLWWLVFPAFGMAMSAAHAFSRARRLPQGAPASTFPPVMESAPEAPRLAAAVPAAPAPAVVPEARPADPRIAARLARVDGVIEKLLADLAGAPRAVRELIRKPEETVAALRAASHELARREEGLRAMVTPEEDQRLRQERAELEARVAAQPDAVVKARLGGAIEALDGQLANRAALATAAERIEAEGTRILYSLENLRANVLRMSTADSTSADLAGDGIRDGLDQLSREMDTVATALEEIHASELGRREAGAVATSTTTGAPGANAAGAAAARARGVTAG